MEKKRLGIYAMVPIDLLTDDRVTPNMIKAYAAISSFQGNSENAWPSRAEISKRCLLSEQHVSRATTALENAGWLEKKRRSSTNKTNVYAVLFPTEDRCVENRQVDQDRCVENRQGRCVENRQVHLYNKKNKGKEQGQGVAKATYEVEPGETVPINQSRYDRICKEYGRREVGLWIKKAYMHSVSKTGNKNLYKDYSAAAEKWMTNGKVQKLEYVEFTDEELDWVKRKADEQRQELKLQREEKARQAQ